MKFLLPAAFAALLAAPVLAQDAASSGSDDLDCAIFVAITIDSVSTEEDPEAAMGLAAGLTYFIGRYEGKGGTDLEADLMGRFDTLSLDDLAGLEGKCSPLLENMGENLQTAGNAFVAAGEAEGGDAEASAEVAE